MTTTTESASPPTLSPFTVGGRPYLPVVPRTFGQVMYLTRQLRAAGVPDQADAGAIMDHLMEHGRLANVIAASYTPAGEKWSRESAEALAGVLYSLTDPADIATLIRVAEDTLHDFFGLSRPGAATSPAASLIQALDRMAQNAAPVSVATTSSAGSGPSSAG